MRWWAPEMQPHDATFAVLIPVVLAGAAPGCDGPKPPAHADASVAPVGPPCLPRPVVRGITVLDDRGRTLNARGVHLVDWDGFLANPAVTLTLRPPADVAFPANATLTGSHPRLYFDLPSRVGATGPSKSIRFESAGSTVQVRVAIFPDRDGADERHELRLTFGGADPRAEVVPVIVHDQDRNLPLLTRILVDFSQDRTGFFDDPAKRALVQQAADDWSYFLDDMHLDPVPAGDEVTAIWEPDGFVTRHPVSNATGYTGFLLYAYGIHSAAVRSGGEGAYAGKPQRSGGGELPLRRSGGLEIETEGNYNTLGWIVDPEPDHWWQSGNLRKEQNDLYSIVHHEMGHAHGFNPAYALFASARELGHLSSKALDNYAGGPRAIDQHDHFEGTVDAASGFGAFGNEFHGQMPRRRWMITRSDLLALEAIGYKLRPLSFEPWRDDVPECP